MASQLQLRPQESPPQGCEHPVCDPNFLVPWTSRRQVFFANVADLLKSRRTLPQPTTSAPDYDFWRSVEVAASPRPHRGFLDSALLHVALIGALYSISFWPPAGPHLEYHLADATRQLFTLSDYLPELHGTPLHTHSHATGSNPGPDDPVPATQEIRSLPPQPDNLQQTIVAPPALRLTEDVPLPNMVSTLPPLQPLEASQRAAGLTLPQLTDEVIAPAVETRSLRETSWLPSIAPSIAAPAPDVVSSGLKQDAPKLAASLAPTVVQPAPEVGQLPGGGARAGAATMAPAIAPPAPGVESAPHARQVIALNLHPAVSAPAKLPEGNRRAEFVASPTGRADASGLAGGSEGPYTEEANLHRAINAPAGIDVAAVAREMAREASTSSTPAEAAASPEPTIPRDRSLAHEATAPLSEVERRVFAGRRSYTMAVNMPNLNAATGSWIIHFAEHGIAGERRGQSSVPIVAPEVIRKSDPAYPGELRRDGVQGTVVLTATIGADGQISNIVVAHSVDPRLDSNAVAALSHWVFSPALRNGEAIALEAVISVPFRIRRGF